MLCFTQTVGSVYSVLYTITCVVCPCYSTLYVSIDQRKLKRKHVERSCGSSKHEADSYFIVPDDYPEPAWWVEALSLYENDRKVLLSEQELTGNIINASQCLLSVQFAGLQDTVLGMNLNFKPVGHDTCTSSVQILHTGTCISVYYTYMYLYMYLGCCLHSEAHEP